MTVRHSLLSALAVLALATSAAGQRPVVVAGDPPLTEETIGRYTEFFEWAFDVHLTNGQREVVRKYVVDGWTQKKKSDIDEVIYMSMSSAMMNSYRISYNTQANFSGNPWRYW